MTSPTSKKQKDRNDAQQQKKWRWLVFLIRSFRWPSCWLATFILALMPMVVAADFGGMLWWTQYLAAISVMVAVVLALPGIFAPENMRLIRQQALLLPVLVWAGYAWFQVVPMSSGIVGLLSPGSQSAYTQWISPFLSPENLPSHFPVSIAADSTMHVAAIAMVLLGILWAASQVLLTRARITLLLSVVALGAGAHSAFGLFRMVYPDVLVMGSDPGPSSFGSFYNRSNAAFMLNMGMASSLGLLSWRLSALSGMEVDDPNFELSDLVALVSDRVSMISVIGLVLCLAGLLACGSRGGLVGCLMGVLLALGWVRQRRGFQTIPIVGVAVLVCVGFLLVPLNLSFNSLKRFDVFSSQDASTLIRSGRLDHWQDGWDTALAHLPAGSGLSTYAYAYLPHQQRSIGRWYYHADNLWLEMFTETGVVGLLLTIWLFVIWIQSLRRLSESADAIDQCLRVTGWYLLAVVIVTQFFDFGLIVPANLFMFAMLVAATVSRGIVVGASGGPMVFRSRRSTLMCMAVAGSVLAITAAGVYRLHGDARAESIVLHGDAVMENSSGDANELVRQLAHVDEEIEANVSARLWNVRADLMYQGIRLAELNSARPETPEEATDIYRSSAPAKRRIAYQGAGAVRTISTQSNAADYREVLKSSEASLRRLPLGLKARNWQIYLDFVHGDPERSKIAIEQLGKLYRRNPRMLIRLGAFAADLGEYATAKEMWRNSIELSFLVTNDVVQRAEQYDEIDVTEVLPDTPEVARQVASYLIQFGHIRKNLLESSLSRLECDSCQSNAEGAFCEQLAGNVAYALERFDEAFDHYRAALKMTPTDVRMQKRFIRRLRKQGRREDALIAARTARQIFPDDNSFTDMIRQNAADDLRQVESNP